jgi:LacI family transcriptional regulator
VRVVPGAQVERALAGNELGKLIFPKDYTAIVSFRDEVAYPVMNALREQGFSIPGDVSIISFDNLHAEDPSRPFLTSIYAADENIAEISVRLLLERIEDPMLPPRNIVLPVRIFDQGTTAPPPRA